MIYIKCDRCGKYVIYNHDGQLNLCSEISVFNKDDGNLNREYDLCFDCTQALRHWIEMSDTIGTPVSNM